MKTVEIKGMHCQHCVTAVKGALEKLGLQKVEVSLEKNNAVIEDDNIDTAAVKTAIEDMGFDVVGIE